MTDREESAAHTRKHSTRCGRGHHMLEMILVDWTRMGKGFCLAGQVVQQNQPRIVRPLLAKNRGTGERKLGWPAFALAPHTRWEIFELVAPLSADPVPPHVEDLWVRG